MDLADYWLIEKQLIHKLFKVLVPRYQNYNISYTKMYKAPKPYSVEPKDKAVLELRNNPYPPLVSDMHQNRNLIHNVLLDEAKKAYRVKKYTQIAAKIEEAEKTLTSQDIFTKQLTDNTASNVQEECNRLTGNSSHETKST